MLTNSTRWRTRQARTSARGAAHSRAMAALARAGLAACGVMYIIVGLIALGVAFGHSGTKADNSGALRTIGNSPAGSVALWLLAIGFTGLALWRLSEAAFGAAEPGGYKATTRLASLARAVLYGVIAFSIMKFALGLGAPPSSNKQSKDLTATAMHFPGGQILVGLIGAALVAGGAAYAYSAWQKKFLKRLQFRMAAQTTRRAVTKIGQVGGIARGAVFATAGIFLMVAAADARPGKAKGVDSALRALAKTPFGPWLLALVALGLVLFGIYSWCEARWRAVQ